jgi:hypothetical protein
MTLTLGMSRPGPLEGRWRQEAGTWLRESYASRNPQVLLEVACLAAV